MLFYIPFFFFPLVVGLMLRRYVQLQKPKQLKINVDGDVISVSAEVPMKGLALETEKDGVVFEDNLVDIVPGETVKIVARGLNGGKVEARYLL